MSADALGIRGIKQITGEHIHGKVGAAFLEPLCGKSGFTLPDGTVRKEMADDVVRLINVRFDERDARDALIPADDVQNGHATTACADLNEMRHGEVPVSGSNLAAELAPREPDVRFARSKLRG
jgi:hypothetical protein